MAELFLVPVDLDGNELQNAVLQNLATNPALAAGRIFYSTALGCAVVGNASAFVPLDASKMPAGSIPLSVLAVDPLARANHTGTQLASTISNFDTQVRTTRLDQMAAPTAAVSMNGQTITNLPVPLAGSTQAARIIDVENAVQSSAAGIDSKKSVRVVATTNVPTLSGLLTIDGITLVAGDTTLLQNQTTGTLNGPYTVSSGAWVRRADEDATGEISPGAFWYVEEGTTFGRTQWRCRNTGAITLGTTAIQIEQFGAAAMYTADLGVQLIGNQFSVELAALSGLSVTSSGLKVDPTVDCGVAGAKIARSVSFTVGDGTSSVFVITHNLNTRNVNVDVYLNSGSYQTVRPQIERTTVNTVTIRFSKVPTAGQYAGSIQG